MFSLAPFILIAAGGFGGLLQDQPPEQLPPMRRYEPPVFPLELRASPLLDGHATAAFTIATDGKVIDVVILEASEQAFATELERVVRDWRLQPQPSATMPRREVVRYLFKRTGMVGTATHLEAARTAVIPEQDGAKGVTTLHAGALSMPPVRAAGVLPNYPQAARRAGVQGQVAVSYVIDTAGNVRVPVVLGAADPVLAAAVLSAVREWRFVPVRHHDRAVLVEDARMFTFGRRALLEE